VTDHKPVRVLVFGAGAVGSLLGGILAGAGYEVTLLGRGKSIEHIQQNGLLVELHDRQFRTHPIAVSSSSDLNDRFDVIILTVRTWAVETALEPMSSLLADNGVLVSVQNGIGTDEVITQSMSETPLIAASLTLSADIPAPGTVASSSRSGGIALAPVTSNAPLELVANMFSICKIPVAMHDDYLSMRWSKLLLNQMANGIPAMLDWTPAQVYQDSRIFRLEQAMLRETLRVMQGDGAKVVSLPGFPVPLLKNVLQLPANVARRLLLSRVARGRGEKLPSLLVDLRAGREQLESDWLYGSVATIGTRIGVPAPINQRVNSLLKGIVRNPDLRDMFRNQPDRLIQNVQLAMDQEIDQESSIQH
jgi:2-dehydropantoate 2-reductase